MTFEPAYRAAVNACLWDLQQPRDRVMSLEDSLDRNLRVGVEAFIYHVASDPPEEMVTAARDATGGKVEVNLVVAALSAALRTVRRDR